MRNKIILIFFQKSIFEKNLSKRSRKRYKYIKCPYNRGSTQKLNLGTLAIINQTSFVRTSVPAHRIRPPDSSSPNRCPERLPRPPQLRADPIKTSLWTAATSCHPLYSICIPRAGDVWVGDTKKVLLLEAASEYIPIKLMNCCPGRGRGNPVFRQFAEPVFFIKSKAIILAHLVLFRPSRIRGEGPEEEDYVCRDQKRRCQIFRFCMRI